MVDTDLARKLYTISRDAFAKMYPSLPEWDELTDEKKAVWEEHAHNYEQEVSDAPDD